MALLVVGRAVYVLVLLLFDFEGDVRREVDVEVEVRREDDMELERLGVSEKPESLRGGFMAWI